MNTFRWIWILALVGCSTIVDADKDRLNDAGVPIGCDPDCDDGIDCTEDECVNDVCQHRPLSSRCDTGFVCDPNASGSGCVPGDCGLDCSQAPDCPEDSCYDCDRAGFCNSSGDGCLYHLRDDDKDGHGVAEAAGNDCSLIDPNGDDCDDSNPARYPDHPEVCDGIDNDCDDQVDFTEATGQFCLGELCGNPIDVALTDGVFTHNGTLIYYRKNYNAGQDPFGTSCAPNTGADLIYRLTVNSPMDIRIEAEATSSPAINPMLAVRSAATCTYGSSDFTFNKTCHDNINVADPSSRIFLQRFGDTGSKTLYIMLKGYDSSDTGDFEFRVTVTPSTPLTCSISSIDISDGGLLIGQLGTDNAQSATSECLGSVGSGDTAARFDVSHTGVPSSGEIRAVASDFSPVIYMRGSSCGGSETGCDALNEVALDFASESISLASTNYVMIDGGSEDDLFFLRYMPPEP
ncbi:MAG: putative metal-binding motif-containing protein [Myxococcales bacterium]|nr:putative metal-binding motif-containing protein [Myxococcales bacterium]MCB9707886.1 putative metal-binding motif-containing protein [Myxococcales bacterium]